MVRDNLAGTFYRLAREAHGLPEKGAAGPTAISLNELKVGSLRNAPIDSGSRQPHTLPPPAAMATTGRSLNGVEATARAR